jgi:site-specific recombinase XerD
MGHKKGRNADIGHTGRTTSGNTRDVKVERIGKVTIYKRGEVFYLYYRQGGVSQRRKVEGNLAVARATAHKVMTALNDAKPSPVAYHRTSPEKMVHSYLDAVANVQKLALRTQDRYRAALDRFQDFCKAARLGTIDSVQEATVEDFVKWLRGQKRTRNGARKGKRDAYQVGGVRFILSTCRTAFNWAARHRMLPPFADNPFTLFRIDKLTDDTEKVAKVKIFTPEQEQAFFARCSAWQKDIFEVLVRYGLRVGELTHLLIEDVAFRDDSFVIRSKPWLFWTVKTGRERQLPLLPDTRAIFERAIGTRKAGFVFIQQDFTSGRAHPAQNLVTAQAFRARIAQVVAEVVEVNQAASERDQKQTVDRYCRSLGRLSEKQVRCEFLALTAKIGCPEFTKVHDLRHLFSTRAQSAGLNPILVQDMLGHTTLEMTRRYTHLGIETKRQALQAMFAPGYRAKDVQETQHDPQNTPTP